MNEIRDWWSGLDIKKQIELLHNSNLPYSQHTHGFSVSNEVIEQLYKNRYKMKYILVYDREDHYAFLDFQTAEEMHEHVNEVSKKKGELIDIIYAGKLIEEYKYTEVSRVTEYKPKLL